MIAPGLATRLEQRLRPDPSRVVAQLFVPGHVVAVDRDGRASGVVARVLELDDDDVAAALSAVIRRFGPRHRDIRATFRHHAERVGNRLDAGVELSDERWLLLGATFTQEFAVEAAALCNPSAVASPDQAGAPRGSLRFVMSVRQIGEGHRSSIGFRTGVVDRLGAVAIDDQHPCTTAAAIGHGELAATSLRATADSSLEEQEATRWVLAHLPDRFTPGQLNARLSDLEAQHDTRRQVEETAARLRHVAARSYMAAFPASSALTERVLMPATAVESNGMEDARFVRFVDEDDSVTYFGTYTGFDGRSITQQLLATTDFRLFAVSPLLGAGAANKGLALFPRRIGGRFAALSRRDGARNAIAFSDEIGHWPAATPIDSPPAVWEAVQVGNCGPPIETDAGWLVLTHGVGPMRTYSIGAWLLDLEDPTQVLSRTAEPLLSPQPGEQDGYVPNVVYSCGALVHDGTLMIPFGVADSSIGFATVAVDDLLAAMAPRRPSSTR